MNEEARIKQRRFASVKDLALSFNPSMISFVAMRITGLALVAYLVLHIWSLSTVLGGRSSFDSMMSVYSKPVFALLEYLLLLCVCVHMFNGIRIIVVDWCNMTRRQERMIWYVLAAVILVAVLSVWFFIPSEWMQNPLTFGPGG
jgi:succinate dehydrogenase / fumarate reductase cytochrome b subunit